MSEKTPYEKLGVSETAPFEEIQKAKDNNQIYGVIIGKALYDKSIKLKDALSVIK